MCNRISSAFLVLALALAVACFAGCRRAPPTKGDEPQAAASVPAGGSSAPRPPQPGLRQVPVVVIVLDQSPSSTRTPADRCDEAGARLRHMVVGQRLARLDVTVLGTGDNRHEHEPVQLVGWTTIERRLEAFGKVGAAEAKVSSAIDRIVASCNAHVEAAKDTALFVAFTRARDSLQAHCEDLAHNEACGERIIAVHSDGRETADGRLRTALNAKATGKPNSVPHLDLGEAKTSLCGTAQVLASEPAARGLTLNPERIRAVWSQVLGRPLTWDATCPAPDGGHEEVPSQAARR